MKLGTWTRREFVRGAAGVVALPSLLPRAIPRGFAYVASGQHLIHAFRVQGEQWTPIQQIASTAPAAMAVARDTLFVANDVGLYDRLPRGSVESFRIGPAGHLTCLGRTALSLSATHPRSLAMSPDGTLLAVAAYEGGIYNLFAITADGSLDAPCGIFKDAGCAHPHTLRFDDSGKRLISSDLDVFTVEGGRLVRLAQGAIGQEITPPAEEGFSIRGNCIYDRTVKVAVVPAAKSVTLTT